MRPIEETFAEALAFTSEVVPEAFPRLLQHFDPDWIEEALLASVAFGPYGTDERTCARALWAALPNDSLTCLTATETTLDNAALLCSHHRCVHEYGYVIELGDDRRPRFRDPGGRLVSATSERHGGPDVGWPGIFAATQGLATDTTTIACGWDGNPRPTPA